MGIIFSRFRRKKNTDEILDDIQSDIQSLEENRDLTLQRQKYLIGRLYIYSVLVYIVGAILFYFFYFPVSLADRMFYLMPLLIFPIIVLLLRKLISWYYKREISQSKSKLSELKTKKKQILEDVMNKETYKVAKEILEKYAPEQLKKTVDDTPKSRLSTPVILNNEQQKSYPQITKGTGVPTLALPAPPGAAPVQKPMGPRLLQRQPSPQRRLVRPIIPRERNFIDKIIESIVGDGPNNRYALICRNCAGHNGMALKEDFDYLAFRCAYCGFPNPAQKVRPRHRIHEVRDRTPSEDRRSTDTENEKKTEQIEEKIKEKGDVQVNNDSTNEDDKKSETKIIDSKEDDERSIGEAGSSDDSSAPTDGVRPRKPLHLAEE